MKKLASVLLLAVIVAASGCADSSAAKENTSSNQIDDRETDRLVIPEDGVVCYQFKQYNGYGGGISCLPLNETKVNQ